MAQKISASESPRKRKVLLVISILANFGILFHYKYSSYFGTGLNGLLEAFALSPLDFKNEILPIGLSFHTFQSVSYVVDVYRKKISPEKHLGHYACYVLFFPQMVAGPIEKYEHLGYQLKIERHFSKRFLFKAIPLIITGLFYKMVVADNCAVVVNQAFQSPDQSSGLSLLLAVILFCIEIYADFFGYSLIAQGSAALLGIDLMTNFNFPFFSSNLFQFWRKWHISLTNWFREYVFFPLGGSRSIQNWKRIMNVLIVFVLSGLWHGAGNNYLLWGLLHGILYLFATKEERSTANPLLTIAKAGLTFVTVALLFLLFRVTELSTCKLIIERILFMPRQGEIFVPSFITLFVVIFVFTLEYFVRRKINYELFFEGNVFQTKLLLFVMLTSILAFGGIEDLPFIYFQF